MHLVNGLISIVLARRFGPDRYREYLTALTLVSVLTIFTRGLQTAVAQEYASVLKMRRSGNAQFWAPGETQATLLSAKIIIIWFFMASVLVSIGSMSLTTAALSVPLLVIASFSSLVNGRLQGTGRFTVWRLLLLASTLLQIPFVAIAVEMDLQMSLFILIAAFPTVLVLLIYYSHPHLRVTQMPERHIKNRLDVGMVLVIAALGSQSPLFLVKRISDSPSLGSTIIFITGCNLLNSISGTFGASQFRSHIRKDSRLGLRRTLLKHLSYSAPIVVFTLLFYFVGGAASNFVFGSMSLDRIDKTLIMSGCWSFICWGVFHSVINERLNEIPLAVSMVMAASLVIVSGLVVIATPAIWVFFLMHGCGPLLLSITILRR